MDAKFKRLLVLVSNLSRREGRQAAARALAKEVGADDLMIYVSDANLTCALPAPGFQQTLPDGRRWHNFICACGSEPLRSSLPWNGEELSAVGFSGSCGSVLVLLGGSPDIEVMQTLTALLPLISAAFGSEIIEVLAKSNAALAEQNATQSKILTSSLDKARQALRKALADAQAASKAKDQFLATLSHELRTPLTPVLLLAVAIEEDPLTPNEFREDIATIRRNVELEVRLIDDLLDLSRIVSGKMRMRREEVDFNSAVRHAIDNCSVLIAENQLTLREELGNDLPLLSGDSTRIQQVIWNLLRNAAKFTPAGGTVSIRSEVSATGGVRAIVSDNGIGIDTEKLNRIFGAFEQVYSETLLESGGLGLGLAIAKAIVSMHGGTISAQSAGLGHGATFSVELPEVTVGPSLQDRALPGPGSRQPRCARILLVEDNSDSAGALERLLSRCGHELTVCANIASSLAVLEQHPIELVISDIGLPDGTGYDLMRTVALRYDLPGIAMSGYGTDADIRKSHEAGFAEHLVKPMRFELLNAAIQKVLSEARGTW